MKVSELEGQELDWAVMKATGLFDPYISVTPIYEWAITENRFAPSTDWRIGGPIIDRYCICLFRHYDRWFACLDLHISANALDGEHFQPGHTPLIAAMRCFVASKCPDNS